MRSLAQIEQRAFGSNRDVLDTFRVVQIIDLFIYKLASVVGEHMLYTIGPTADISICLSLCPKNIFAHVLIQHLAVLAFKQVHGDESGISIHNHKHCLISSCIELSRYQKISIYHSVWLFDHPF